MKHTMAHMPHDPDTSASSLLNDPKLPMLATAMDASAMVDRFNDHLHNTCSELEWEVVRCAIEKVYYQRFEHCGLGYRLTFRHSSGAEAEEWLYARMYPAESGPRRFQRAAKAITPALPAHSFLQEVPTVSYWQEMNMILWLFPQDPKLAKLPHLADPDFVRERIEANLPAFEISRNGKPVQWRCTEVRFDRVKNMPAKRCVLRYHVNLNGPDGAGRELTFYSKTYNDSKSRYHFDLLRATHEQLVARHVAVQIPRPILHLDGANTFWQEEWPGQALAEAIDELDWDELFPRIAATLASLHRSALNGFQPGPSLDEVLKTAAEDGRQLVHLLPQYQSFVDKVIERLEAIKGTLAKQSIPMVPIHGALRLEQMLIRGTELALVDFDAIALGDPLFDVAEFIASLQFWEFSQDRPRNQLARATDLFLNAYAGQVPWPCEWNRIAFYVSAFLMSKMFAPVKHLEIEVLQRLEIAGHEIMEAWLEVVT